MFSISHCSFQCFCFSTSKPNQPGFFLTAWFVFLAVSWGFFLASSSASRSPNILHKWAKLERSWPSICFLLFLDQVFFLTLWLLSYAPPLNVPLNNWKDFRHDDSSLCVSHSHLLDSLALSWWCFTFSVLCWAKEISFFSVQQPLIN